MGGFPDVICGGGGGVTSEATPHADGHDMMYGFMDYKISKDKMTITAISHKGITMKKATIKPRPRGGHGTPRRRRSAASGCCSWAWNNECGKTTEYCRSGPEPCRKCKGHWVPHLGEEDE